MNEKLKTIAQSRRAFPRYGSGIVVKIEPSDSDNLLSGVTLNVSRGGMVVRLSEPLEVGERYRIHFRERYGSDRGQPEQPCSAEPVVGLVIPNQSIWARVLRIGEGMSGRNVAFQFEIQLEIEREPDRQAA